MMSRNSVEFSVLPDISIEWIGHVDLAEISLLGREMRWHRRAPIWSRGKNYCVWNHGRTWESTLDLHSPRGLEPSISMANAGSSSNEAILVKSMGSVHSTLFCSLYIYIYIIVCNKLATIRVCDIHTNSKNLTCSRASDHRKSHHDSSRRSRCPYTSRRS